jgi:hypothetical protein
MNRKKEEPYPSINRSTHTMNGVLSPKGDLPFWLFNSTLNEIRCFPDLDPVLAGKGLLGGFFGS